MALRLSRTIDRQANTPDNNALDRSRYSVIYSYVVASPKHPQTLSSRLRLGQLFPLSSLPNRGCRDQLTTFPHSLPSMSNDDPETTESASPKSSDRRETAVADTMEAGMRPFLGLIFALVFGSFGFGLGFILGLMVGVFVSIPFSIGGFLVGCFWIEIRLLLQLLLPFWTDS